MNAGTRYCVLWGEGGGLISEEIWYLHMIMYKAKRYSAHTIYMYT